MKKLIFPLAILSASCMLFAAACSGGTSGTPSTGDGPFSEAPSENLPAVEGSALETVIVPKQLSVIDSAFGECENIKSVFYEGEELVSGYRVHHESDKNEANGYGNKYYSAGAFYLYSEEPNPDGEHRHYDEEGKPEIWE